MDGQRRWCWLHVPDGYSATEPAPLVLSFHGRGNPVLVHALLTGFTHTADREGFIAVYPKGIGFPEPAWNAGQCCGEALEQGVDDVAFADAMLGELERELCVDTRRVYATGFSNGSYMSHRLACDRSERFAAIAGVGGGLRYEACDPSRPVPVLHIHGTADETVPFDRALETTEFWRDVNGCGGSGEVVYDNGDATCEAWTDCATEAPVELCTIEGGGHTWPGGLDNVVVEEIGGEVSDDLEASDAIWSFLSRHALP